VFPSLWEGFGLPVLEAMACGTPVITSNLSSLPEVAGQAAILIDPYNVGELAEAMTAVASDSSLWAWHHDAGLAQVKAFSWEKTGRQTSAILQQYL
jgi:glycosyltransferase involved in cell wall biosynthesis